jgi:hypothetical protein
MVLLFQAALRPLSISSTFSVFCARKPRRKTLEFLTERVIDAYRYSNSPARTVQLKGFGPSK